MALVIGNSFYTALPPIPTCAASAHVVTAALKRAGYSVTEQLDDSNGRMGSAFSDFADALSAAPGADAVLYVCSYAVGFDGRAFLLPVSAKLERPTDALTQGVLAKLPIGTMSGSQVEAGLVLLDSFVAPGSDSAAQPTDLIDVKATNDTGLVVARAASAPPQGPSSLATALSTMLAQPDVEVGATVRALQGAFGGVAANLTLHAPVTASYLVGGPKPAVEATVPPAAANAPSAQAGVSPADHRRAQLSLQRLGYFHGRVNGVTGADTINAIRRYQVESREQPTGRLTTDQLNRLLEDGR